MSYGATRAKGWPALRYLVEVRVVGDVVQPEDGEEGEDVEGDQDAGVSGNDFWTFGNGNGNGSTHSQTLGTGTGMKNCIPNFWERERE